MLFNRFICLARSILVLRLLHDGWACATRRLLSWLVFKRFLVFVQWASSKVFPVPRNHMKSFGHHERRVNLSPTILHVKASPHAFLMRSGSLGHWVPGSRFGSQEALQQLKTAGFEACCIMLHCSNMFGRFGLYKLIQLVSFLFHHTHSSCTPLAPTTICYLLLLPFQCRAFSCISFDVPSWSFS